MLVPPKSELPPAEVELGVLPNKPPPVDPKAGVEEAPNKEPVLAGAPKSPPVLAGWPPKLNPVAGLEAVEPGVPKLNPVDAGAPNPVVAAAGVDAPKGLEPAKRSARCKAVM